MEIPSKYVMPCKSNGMCRSNELAEQFPDDPNFPPNRVALGVEVIEFKPFGSPDYWENRVTFKCCTGCHLPFNNKEAVRLNEEIGLELPSTQSIKERLAKLREARGKR